MVKIRTFVKVNGSDYLGIVYLLKKMFPEDKVQKNLKRMGKAQ